MHTTLPARRIGTIAGTAVGAVAFTGITALAGAGGIAHAAPAASCATGLEALGPDAVARASDTALAEVAASFPDRDVAGAYVAGATRSESGPVGRQVADQCGGVVQSRTVIVDFVFPAMLPDAAKSYGAAVVSDIDGAYRVWRTA